MAWICGKHLADGEVADGQACPKCGHSASGRGWSAPEIAAQKAAFEAKGGTWGKNPVEPVVP